MANRPDPVVIKGRKMRASAINEARTNEVMTEWMFGEKTDGDTTYLPINPKIIGFPSKNRKAWEELTRLGIIDISWEDVCSCKKIVYKQEGTPCTK